MNINLTMLGQAISFILFVLFCMKFVWPPLVSILRERQQAIADGLEKAAAAERQLEEANAASDKALEAAKQQAAEIISQAESRAQRIVEEARTEAEGEAERIRQSARGAIDLEINQAREALRTRVGELALEGAEKILEASVDAGAHRAMLDKLAGQL